MVVVDLGGGGAEPVTVVEVKAWCRIDRPDEDGLLAALVQAAREAVERETRAVLVRRAFRLSLETVAGDRRVRLPRRPVVGLSAVTAFEADGTPRGFGAGGATMDRARGADVLTIREDVAAAATNGVEIEFVAGFEVGAVPEALKLAIMRIVAASYEMRGAVAADMQPAFVPRAARELIAPFREARL